MQVELPKHTWCGKHVTVKCQNVAPKLDDIRGFSVNGGQVEAKISPSNSNRKQVPDKI